MRDDPSAHGAASEAEGEGPGSQGRDGSGWARGLGMLSAMKEALDEAIQEARERGDLTSDRAREVLGRAAERAREATSDARERFDFPTRADFEALSARVSELERRVGGRLSDVPDDDEGGRGEGGTGAGA